MNKAVPEVFSLCFFEQTFALCSRNPAGGAGLAPEECKQLFEALDKDADGKLTVNEFIDYVFSDASAAGKMILSDGFGLDAIAGLPEDRDLGGLSSLMNLRMLFKDLK